MPDERENHQDDPASQAGHLRERQSKKEAGPEEPDRLEAQETQRLLHELQVHQTELQVQNEELRRIQQELEASRERYVDLFDFAPVAYVTVSETGLIIKANLTATRLLEVPRDSLVKSALSRFILSEDQNIYYKHRRQLFRTGKPQASELRLVRPDGSTFWALLETTLYQDSENGVPVCQSAISNIGNLKQVMQALQEKSNYFKNLLDSACTPIIVWDRQCRVTEFNSAFERLSSLSAAEVIGKPVDSLFPKDFALIFQQGLSGECLKNLEIPYRLKDGSERLLLWNSAVVCAADGQTPIAVIAQGVDISDRTESVRLKSLLDERDGFVAMLAHDLKSPLSGCMRMTDLLLGGNLGTLNASQRNALSLLRLSNRSLLAMVDNLLTVYRMENAAYKPQTENTDIAALIEDCCLEIKPLAAIRNVGIDTELMPDLGVLEVDGMALRRVVQNLLDNAQKFTSQGSSISVSARREMDKLVIEVGDRGPGIPEADQRKLFQRFFQGSLNSKYRSGIGLGLYLCKQLVTAHGGELGYRSRDGGGSTFCVVLPARPGHIVVEETAARTKLIPVVLVEDYAITRLGLRTQLEQAGEFQILGEAGNGEVAYKMISELKPVVAVLDIGLPDISGIEVCRLIKSEHPAIRVLMLTSHDAADDVLAALSAGADGYCLKDNSGDTLLKAVKCLASEGSWIDPRVVGYTHESLP